MPPLRAMSGGKGMKNENFKFNHEIGRYCFLMMLSLNLFAGLIPSGKIPGTINSAAVDSKGQLWVLTSGSYDNQDSFVPGHLLKYDQEKGKFMETPQLVCEESGWFGQLVIDKYDNKWMTAGYSGTMAYRFDGKEWKTFDLQGGRTTVIPSDRGNELFFLTNSTLVRIDTETLEVRNSSFKELLKK